MNEPSGSADGAADRGTSKVPPAPDVAEPELAKPVNEGVVTTEDGDLTLAIRVLSGLVTDLLDRVSELEDAVAENNEHVDRMRKDMADLRKMVARRSQLKKLEKLNKNVKTLLARIEVVDEELDN